MLFCKKFCFLVSMCDTPGGRSPNYECLRPLVGQVCQVSTTFSMSSSEGRIDRVGDDWVVLVDKKGVEHVINTKYILQIVKKP